MPFTRIRLTPTSTPVAILKDKNDSYVFTVEIPENPGNAAWDAANLRNGWDQDGIRFTVMKNLL